MSNVYNKYIGEMIKTIRKTAQMTQHDLAAKLKISTQQVHKYESAEDNISAVKLLDIADIFGCDMKIFFPKREIKDYNVLRVSEKNKTFLNKKTKDDDAILLLKYFFSCKKDDKKKIFEFAKNIAKKNK